MNNKSIKQEKHKQIVKTRIKIGIWIISLILFIFFITTLDLSTNNFGAKKVINNLSKLFHFNNFDSKYPSNTILYNSIKFMFITIRVVSLGTIIGFSFGLLTSILSTKEISKKFRFIIKGLVIFLRSFPIIIFIYATQKGFEKEMAAMLILSWFTWLWSSKYITDMFESSIKTPYNENIKKGTSKLNSFGKEIIGRNNDKIFSLFLHTFESNLRWSTLLGSLGIIGIGEFINSNIPKYYENISYPLIVLFIVILFFETIIWLFNKYIMSDKTKKSNKLKSHINWRKITKILFVLFFISLSLYSILIMNFNIARISGFPDYIRNVFHPNIDSWNSNNNNINPWLMIWSIFKQCYISIFITVLFSIIIAIFSCQKISNGYMSLFIKFLISSIRVIPIFIIFRILNPYFNSPISLGILVISIHSITTLSQKYVISINNIGQSEINSLKILGYGFWWRWRYLIIPKISKEAFSNTLFTFINMTRTIVLLGVFGTSILGGMIHSLNSRSHIPELFGYAWPLMIYMLFWELLLEKFKIKIR